MAFHVCSSTHHRGPLIIIAIGMGFGIVGAIPVAVNFALEATNSGTIIGVGFIGFGLLLIVPGLVWCVVQRLMALKKLCECCRSGSSRRDSTMCLEETAPVLISKQSRCSAVDASLAVIHHECLKDDDEFPEENSVTTHDDDTVFISIEVPERPESSR